jgi:dihydroneopterin aldolase
VTSDRISLRGLRVLAVCGALPEERDRAQPFEIDLEVEADLAPAAASDDLAQTIDYAELSRGIERIATAQPYQLMEAMAGRIAELALEDPRAHAVTVTVRKLRPPVPEMLDTAGVVVRRAR